MQANAIPIRPGILIPTSLALRRAPDRTVIITLVQSFEGVIRSTQIHMSPAEAINLARELKSKAESAEVAHVG